MTISCISLSSIYRQTHEPQKSKWYKTSTVCMHLCLFTKSRSGWHDTHSMLQLASSTWAMGSSSRGEGRLFRSESLSTSLRHNMNKIVARPTYCPIVAALAAPITPQPATKTKNRSRPRLTAFAAALAISGVLHHTTVHRLIARRSLVSGHHYCCRSAAYPQDHGTQVCCCCWSLPDMTCLLQCIEQVHACLA